MTCLILSVKWSRGDHWVWWRTNAMGYTCDVDAAGRFELATALRHCSGSHGDSIPVPVEVVETLIAHRVVTMRQSDLLRMRDAAELLGAEVYPDAPSLSSSVVRCPRVPGVKVPA